jgi:hypothetical protein
MFTPPAEVSAVLAAFAPLFTEPSWLRAQALLCGVLLAPANHTLTAALRALGLAGEPGFQNYHRLLNRARWSARQAAQVLLKLLVEAFVPEGPVIIGLDDTIERRRGRKLTARAIYYDAARSSKACFQKTSGLRWMSLALLVPVRWAARVWALPFLTALCPSERYAPYVQRSRRHKPLVERARGLLGQVRRWLPERALIVVADSSYAALELLAWCARQVRPITVITRLRLDAALYAPAPVRRRGQRGPRRLKGERVRKLTERLQDGRTRWQACRLQWMAGRSVGCNWPPAPPCGMTAASRRWRSAGCWCVIPKTAANLKPSSRPISTCRPARSSSTSSGVGPWRPPSRKPAFTSGWTANANGMIWPPLGPRRRG